MTDTARSVSEIKALLADNIVEAISPQDVRDLVESLVRRFPGSGFDRGFIDVRDHDLQGDGVTDNSDMIDAMFASIPWYEIGPGYPAPEGWPHVTGGFKATPQAMLGGIGAIIFFPPGVYCHSRPIFPDLRGGTEESNAARKVINFLGAGGFGQSTLHYIGPVGLPQMILGGNGDQTLLSPSEDFEVTLATKDLNAGASDNQGFVSDLGFNGGAKRYGGEHWQDAVEHAEHNLVLVECTSLVVQRCGFGNVRGHGIYSVQQAALTGNDYGSIDLTVRDNFFSFFGRVWGKGCVCKDPHALRILDNESGGACLSGDLEIGAGGGNGHLIQGNSWEGVGQISGRDLDTEDFTNFPNSYGGLRPDGTPVWPSKWDTLANGAGNEIGNHAVVIRVNSDTLYTANAHEDTVGPSSEISPRLGDIRMLYIEGGSTFITGGNDIRTDSDYAIGFSDTGGDTVIIEDNVYVTGRLGAVDTRNLSDGFFVYEAKNAAFNVNMAEPTQAKIKHGPGPNWFGFSPRLIVGDYMAAKGAIPTVGVPNRYPLQSLTGAGFHTTLDVRGQLEATGGMTTGILGGRAPMDADFMYPVDGTFVYRGKLAVGEGRGEMLAEPGDLDIGTMFTYYWDYVTAAGTTIAENPGNPRGIATGPPYNEGVCRLWLPYPWPLGVTALEIWRGINYDNPRWHRATLTEPVPYFDDSMSQAALLALSPRTDMPATNTSDSVNRWYVRAGGTWRYVDLT